MGLTHDSHAPESRRHSKLEPPSLEVKEKVASGSLLSVSGLLVRLVPGGVVSMVQLAWAGLGSVTPLLLALTAKS